MQWQNRNLENIYSHNLTQFQSIRFWFRTYKERGVLKAEDTEVQKETKDNQGPDKEIETIQGFAGNSKATGDSRTTEEANMQILISK